MSAQVSRPDNRCWRPGLTIRRSWVRAPPMPSLTWRFPSVGIRLRSGLRPSA